VEADVLIIGAGASGAAAAWSMSELTNSKIVVLEQGDYVDAGKYPSRHVDWELRRQEEFNVHPNVRQRTADYPVDDSDSPIRVANFNAVGGSTILYSGHFPRLHPSDFCTNRLDSVGVDWPLSYDDLTPFFSLNDRMMGVAGLVGDTAYPPHEHLQPPVPMGKMGRKLAESFNKLGWHWWPSYSAINTRKHENRGVCINLGPCNTGCAQGAKASVDVTYWPAALRAGVKLITKARVSEITINPRGRTDGVVYIDENGASHRVKARIVILAASGLGTPRLLLMSKSNAFPNGLANESGLVGRNLMLHPLGYVEGVFEDDLESSIGPQGCCILSQQFYETHPKHEFKRGYTMQILRGSPPVETAVNGYFARRIRLGSEHHKTFRETFNRTAGIAIISEDLPEFRNFIELDNEKSDSSGLAGVKIHYKLSENTQKILKHGLNAAKMVIEAAGAEVTVAHAPVRHAGWHIMGTARMGNHPRDSVVNRYGQAHDVPNLFIADSSVFPTGGAVNPVSSAQAVALFICAFIKRNYSEIV
jgi:choline dehydrogenase-like flavoprotein